jgi:putative ABC transport system permease protein
MLIHLPDPRLLAGTAAGAAE